MEMLRCNLMFQKVSDVQFKWIDVQLLANDLKASTNLPEGFIDWQDDHRFVYDDEIFDLIDGDFLDG